MNGLPCHGLEEEIEILLGIELVDSLENTKFIALGSLIAVRDIVDI